MFPANIPFVNLSWNLTTFILLGLSMSSYSLFSNWHFEAFWNNENSVWEIRRRSEKLEERRTTFFNTLLICFSAASLTSFPFRNSWVLRCILPSFPVWSIFFTVSYVFSSSTIITFHCLFNFRLSFPALLLSCWMRKRQKESIKKERKKTNQRDQKWNEWNSTLRIRRSSFSREKVFFTQFYSASI